MDSKRTDSNKLLKWKHNHPGISLLSLKPLLDSQLMYLHSKDIQNRHICEENQINAFVVLIFQYGS